MKSNFFSFYQFLKNSQFPLKSKNYNFLFPVTEGGYLQMTV